MRKSGNDRHVASNQIDYKSMLECQRSTLEIIEDGMRLVGWIMPVDCYLHYRIKYIVV